MKDKLIRFMQGRYGVDQLTKFMMNVTLGIFVTTIILNLLGLNSIAGLLYWIAMFLIVYSYVRILSKNIQKRYAQNQKFLFLKGQILRKLNSEKSVLKQRKYYHFYRCPSCNQRIRIPKGKGRIEISCPKCRTKFIKKS